MSQTLGRFTLTRELGRGATAQVFLAEAPGERVALKIFHPGLWDRADLRKRALAEFKAASSLDHPNIVRVIEPLWDEERLAVAFQYVEGGSLEDLQKSLPYVLPELAALIAIEVLKALEHAHSRGVVHRDLKPANILVGLDGGVFVSDFGLARMTDLSQHTLSGTLIGSPDYMAPEQARGDVVSARSDLFSVASILYFLMTGTRPFSRNSPLATLAAVSEARVEPVRQRNPKISGRLGAILHRNLSLAPALRCASAAEFRAELETYLADCGLGALNLRGWFESSSGAVLAALQAQAEALTLRGERLLAEKNWDAFLENLSHLALVAPESPAPARLMEEYERARPRRRRRAAAWLIASGLGAGAVAAIVAVQLGRAAKAPAAPSADALAASRAPPEPAARTVARAHAPAAVRSVPKPAVAPPVRRTGVVALDLGPDVVLYWDGRKVDPSRPFARQSVGEHLLRLEKPGQAPLFRTVMVEEREPTQIRVR